jgi:hypothetical protein
MAAPLPPRPNLEWLRKTAKQRLAELRRHDTSARLSDAQLTIAREYGFASRTPSTGCSSTAHGRTLQTAGVRRRPTRSAGSASAARRCSGTWRREARRRRWWRSRASATSTRWARAAARDATQVIVDAVLWAAADGSQTEAARWLLARGARPNARTGPPSRHTALHAAGWHGNLPLVTLLVDSGAEVHARDDEHDSTPLGWAETSIEVTGNPGWEEVAEYLRAFGDGARPARSSES